METEIWLEQDSFLAEEPAVFWEGHSSIDQCLMLQHLIEKYCSSSTSSLDSVFIDFKSAFDSINQTKVCVGGNGSLLARSTLAFFFLTFLENASFESQI